MARTGVDVPLWESYRERLEDAGPWARPGAAPTSSKLPALSFDRPALGVLNPRYDARSILISLSYLESITLT